MSERTLSTLEFIADRQGQNSSECLILCETTIRYRADISAGSLKITETRVIAELLLRGVDEQEWKKALLADKVLQARNPATAIRLGRLIKSRLILMDAELWKIICEGTGSVVVHAVLAAAIKH